MVLTDIVLKVTHLQTNLIKLSWDCFSLSSRVSECSTLIRLPRLLTKSMHIPLKHSSLFSQKGFRVLRTRASLIKDFFSDFLTSFVSYTMQEYLIKVCCNEMVSLTKKSD